jgi:hypothetical protein
VASRVLILGSACLALALGGCSLSPTSSSNSSGFTGAKAVVATKLNLLASDANSANGSDICKNVLGQALRASLNREGGCQTDIDNQLKTIDDFSLSIESIKVTGSTATAQVKTEYYGKKVYSPVKLAHEHAGWRIVSIGAL